MLHKKCLILGSSRGLGACLSKSLNNSIGVSRSDTSEVQLDLTHESASESVVKLVDQENIDVVFYVAGGGPHGNFLSKPWHSHEWAIKLNALTPLKIFQNLPLGVGFIYIGSAIAERSESEDSLSYSWSKKFAKKAILSSPNKEALVFSPPYMDTGLLPKGAWPRINCPELVLDPQKVADKLLDWVSNREPDDKCFDWMERFPYDLPQDCEFQI